MVAIQFGEEAMRDSVGDTAIVEVKLDSQSRELLTWALVKIAKPGDTVVALHVIGKNEIVDSKGRSCFLSLVEDFDSFLAAYEGFCNLKEVNLKLKICRGASTREILLREANSCKASTVIMPSTPNAKYCSKRVSNNCSVLAVLNGKIIFPKEKSQGAIALRRSASINSNALHSKSINKRICAPLLHRQGTYHPLSEVTRSPPIQFPERIPEEILSLQERSRFFDYHELFSATNKFSSENVIGKGGSSLVYKGRLFDGNDVAVKMLKRSDLTVNEIVLEVEIVTSLHHKNIVTLRGFSFDSGKLFLVYDLLSKGSLQQNLHCEKVKMGWAERFKTAIGVAEALDYIHSKCEKPVIHRDVKSSNILLSDEFEPQLCDFGLATWAWASAFTDVVGTFGYLAPEYFMHGKVSEKIDVYAFGVVLLELLSGRIPIANDRPKGQESLVVWAKPILENGKVTELMDPNLDKEPDSNSKNGIQRMFTAASLCTRTSPKARPTMGLVVGILKGEVEANKWARAQAQSAEEYDEESPRWSMQSHVDVALLDTDEDSLSTSSVEQNVDEYFNARWSPSSSFNY